MCTPKGHGMGSAHDFSAKLNLVLRVGGQAHMWDVLHDTGPVPKTDKVNAR